MLRNSSQGLSHSNDVMVKSLQESLENLKAENEALLTEKYELDTALEAMVQGICTHKLFVQGNLCNLTPLIEVGMTFILGGLIQYHVQFMYSIIACLIYDQANIVGGGGGGYSPSSPHGFYTSASRI